MGDVRSQRQIKELQSQALHVERGIVTGLNPLTLAGSAASDVELPAMGWYTPAIGDDVRVLRGDGAGLILGTATPNQVTRPPSTGTVSSVEATSATVSAGGVSYSVPWLTSYTPTTGHTVALLWQLTGAGFDGVILGQVSGTPAAATPSTVTGDTSIGVQSAIVPNLPNPYTVTASEIATWRGGWRRDTASAYQGDWTGSGDNSGFWFYSQAKLRRLQGLVITATKVYMHAGAGGSFGATTAKLNYHSSARRGSTKPTLSQAWDGPALADGAAAWGTVPTGVSADLVASGGGLAVASTGRTFYSSFKPLSSDSMSGAIKFYWRTAEV